MRLRCAAYCPYHPRPMIGNSCPVSFIIYINKVFFLLGCPSIFYIMYFSWYPFILRAWRHAVSSSWELIGNYIFDYCLFRCLSSCPCWAPVIICCTSWFHLKIVCLTAIDLKLLFYLLLLSSVCTTSSLRSLILSSEAVTLLMRPFSKLFILPKCFSLVISI